MKKILIVSLLLCGFYTQADMYTSSHKDNFVELHLGAGPVIFTIIPTFSLGYGKHIINSSNSYLGFWGLNWSMLTILEAKYGYEFMRQNTFSFGLDISALLSVYLGLGGLLPSKTAKQGFLKSIMPGFGGGTGIFMQARITKSISAFLRTGGWVVYNFYFLDWTPTIIPYIALGTRYHF